MKIKFNADRIQSDIQTKFVNLKFNKEQSEKEKILNIANNILSIIRMCSIVKGK